MPGKLSRQCAHCTYLVCAAKSHSVAVSVYIPSGNGPIGHILTGYVQEIGFSVRSNCTYEVCASPPSYRQVTKQRAIDIGPKFLDQSFVKINFFRIFEKKSRVMDKTINRIIIENPPKKVLDFVMRVQKEKEENRKHLLDKKEHTFSIQM